MKNELVTLFEQCCENNDIPKQKRTDKELIEKIDKLVNLITL